MKKCSFLFSSFVCFTILPELLLALPQSPSVVAGDVAIQNQQSRTMVVKASDRAIIEYKSFDIHKGEKVQFIQPSHSSTVLNRVTGKKASKILGQLESNGKVLLVNPNGMYFGPHASVRVASLVASTLDISNEDFIKGQYSFFLENKEFLSEIRNDGLLSASPEGSIVLLAPVIRNFGTIQAKAGRVVLAGGESVTLDFHGDGLLQFSVEGDIKGAVIQHLGSIQADGGEVQMHLPTAKRAIHEIVNKEGIERGEVFVKENGEIFLVSSSSILAQKVSLEASTLSVDGNIDASNQLGKGGEIRLAGADISIRGAKIDSSGFLGGGDVFIGGEYQGGGSMPYASKVSMDSDSYILANAIEEGNGGKIVLWSSEETEFEGNLFAQGGVQGGNGGVIETSSLENLSVQNGNVNAIAPLGKTGEWLLDPGILNIDLVGGAVPGCVTSGTQTVDVSVIENASAAVILCANEINVNAAINMVNTNIGILFTAPPNEAGILNLNGGLVSEITTIGGDIIVRNMSTVLGKTTLLDTTNGGAYPAGGPIVFQSIDASAAGQGLGVVSGLAVSSFDSIGEIFPLSNVVISSARQFYVDDIIVTGSITSSASIFLKQDSIFSAGGDITIKTLDSTLAGTASIIMNSTSGSIVVEGIGNTSPLQSVSILNAAPGVITGNIFTQGGDVTIIPSMKLFQPLTRIKTFSDLNNYLSGDITLGNVLPDIDGIRSLTISGGLNGSATLGNLGTGDLSLAAVIIDINQPLVVEDIYSKGLLISTGSGFASFDGTIDVQNNFIFTGRSVAIGGPISASTVSMVTVGSISNQTIPQPITASSTGAHAVLLNALRGGNIGSQTSPIEVNTEGDVTVGGSLVYLSGDHPEIQYVKNNRPCLLLFRGVSFPCILAHRQIFESLPKQLFRNFFFNSLTLGIGYPLPVAEYGPEHQNSSFAPIKLVTDSQLPALKAI